MAGYPPAAAAKNSKDAADIYHGDADDAAHGSANATMHRISQTTLTQFIIRETEGDQELAILMNAMQHAGKVTANAIAKAGAMGNVGLAGSVNFTGDDVKVLDIISNDIFIAALSNSGVCGVMVSEENPDPIYPQQLGKKAGKYAVAFDPLDGSSNIDCNVSIGTIFGVYKRDTSDKPAVLGDILRPGKDLLLAGYVMYGAGCEMVLALKKKDGSASGVQRFSLDPAIQEFLYIGNVTIPEGGGKKIYSCNEGNSPHWDTEIKEYVAECKEKSYASRYVGSMVADIHRTLLYGGIFLYPADKKSTKGKLRLLYEGFPMAMITEQAGGVASAGMFKGKVQRVLDLQPENIHDKCPIIMGCPRDVNNVIGRYPKA
jgi:fructose-1,6-bisphosphatase I